MKRLYAFTTIKQILESIDKSAGDSDAEKRRALDLALENNFVTSLTSLVVTGAEGEERPRVVATSKLRNSRGRPDGRLASYGAHTTSGMALSNTYTCDTCFMSISRPRSMSKSRSMSRGMSRGKSSRGLKGGRRFSANLKKISKQQKVTTTTSPPPLITSTQPLVSGCKLRLYDNTYLRGKSLEIEEDMPDLAALGFADKLASLKVEGSCQWEIFQGE